MKIKIVKEYKKLQPDQVLDLNDEYAKGLIAKGVAKKAEKEEAKK